MTIQLEPRYLQIVKTILKTTVPDRHVVVFGSRATNTCKPHSDLDLCVMGEQPLSLEQLASLTELFSESDLPMRVDLVDWASTTPQFQTIIKQHSVQIT